MGTTARSKAPTRRTFLGWWIAGLLGATVISAAGPLALYLVPARSPNQTAGKIRVSLSKAPAYIAHGTAVRLDSPQVAACKMADGGKCNSAGDLTFGGFLTRDNGTLRAFAITCPHL